MTHLKGWQTLAALLVLSATATANAAVSDEQFRQLQQALEQALQRIDQLERQQAEINAAQQAAITATAEAGVASANAAVVTADQVAAISAKQEQMSWAERISIKGDFRYRYQYDDIGNPVDDTRNRNRIRARPELTAQLDPMLLVGFGLASGSDDPVSTNQTLGDGNSSKEINLDLAYVTWTGVRDTAITGGKFRNPLITVGGSQLQWDSDWRPEGGAISWTNGTFFANGLGNYLESDSDADNGSTLATLLQAGVNFDLGPAAMTAGVGYTNISTEGEPCFYSDSSGFATGVPLTAEFCAGNQATPAQFYADDFSVYNVFAQGAFTLGDLPLAVYADFINNSDADDYEQGYQVGLVLGSLKAAGDWQLTYYYEDLESNATLGLLTSSDFGGGGTNVAGSSMSAGYAVSAKTNVQLTYNVADKNSDNIATINNGDDYSYDTVQADLNFKYK